MTFDSLAAQALGRVLLPGDEGFASRSKPFNERYAATVPAAVLAVASSEDVATAIRWARENSVPLVARGGGHSYAGTSVNTGLVLDLRGLSGVHVDPDTALVTVGGGTRTGELYSALRPHDIAFPLGNSDEVAIGGLTLGGGVAAVSRAWGLTCDSLVSTDVVLADGSAVTCSATENPDLFWACRGGGGGNFGVNTSFTFQARPVVSSATCLLLWEWDHAVDVMLLVQEIQRTAPDGLSLRAGLTSGGMVSLIGWHLGSADELRTLLAPLNHTKPFRCDIEDRTYWEAVEYVHHETAGGAFAGRTRTTSVPLPEQGVRTLVTAVAKWPGSSNPDGGGAALFGWGGAINALGVTETAFPHREAMFLVSLDTSWTSADSPQVVRDNLEWLTALHEDIGPFADNASYLNFTDPDLADWRQAYHGPNYARLAEVKKRYDPDRFFSFSQAI
ncbi:oxidoreductase [Lentzea aerocolonigenes]|uniref:Oxidoreductase n=1 Tax=Lentzea aerocolonigenes TaxID=68170 RepID=A0A0F0H3G0_LENAE|nr:FAD-binding oxidoreductase [Lentzea aerocolonigenes]KJK48163.1 oxidoreductase [Lentzea aerocolonigenes]